MIQIPNSPTMSNSLGGLLSPLRTKALDTDGARTKNLWQRGSQGIVDLASATSTPNGNPKDEQLQDNIKVTVSCSISMYLSYLDWASFDYAWKQP